MRTVEQIVEEMYEGDPAYIVPNCVVMIDGTETILHPVIAMMRNTVLAARQEDRQAYCDAHNIDETRWVGCHGCDGTGYHLQNRMPCWCDTGRIRSMQLKSAEDKHTDHLREVLSRPVEPVASAA